MTNERERETVNINVSTQIKEHRLKTNKRTKKKKQTKKQTNKTNKKKANKNESVNKMTHPKCMNTRKFTSGKGVSDVESTLRLSLVSREGQREAIVFHLY